MVDEATGYWQGVYEWESTEAVKAYQCSVAARSLNLASPFGLADPRGPPCGRHCLMRSPAARASAGPSPGGPIPLKTNDIDPESTHRQPVTIGFHSASQLVATRLKLHASKHLGALRCRAVYA